MEDSRRDWAAELIALYKDQLNYGAEIVELTELFFQEEITYDEEAMAVLQDEQVPEVLKAFSEQLSALEAFQPDMIKGAIKATQKQTGQKGKKLFMPIRVATTGVTHGPELPDSIHLLGETVVQNRLSAAIEQLTK